MPAMQDLTGDLLHTYPMFDLCEDDRSIGSHGVGVAAHDFQIGADGHSEIGFVDYQKVRLSNPGAAFAGYFVAAGHINDIDGEISQFAAEMRGEVVTAGFDQQELSIESLVKVFQSEQIGGDILANSSVGTTTRLDRPDAVGFEGLMAHEELAILFSEDVVCDSRHPKLMTQFQAQCQHEGGFAAADRSADTHRKGAAAEIADEWLRALVEVARVFEVFVSMALGPVLVMFHVHAQLWNNLE